MSSAGHILDMIKRLEKNREVRANTKNRYNKVKESYEKYSSKNRVLYDKNKLSEEEIKQLRLKIRSEIINNQKKYYTKVYSLLILLVIAIIVGFILIMK